MSLVFISGWLLATGRAGRALGRLPRGVAGWGIGLGAAGLVGALLLVASVLVPGRSVAQEILGYAGLLAGGPTGLAYPVWLIVLSGRLPGHIARSVH